MAKIYFLADMDLSSVDMQTFVESVHIIASHYGIDCIDLYDIKKDWAHPTAEGMTDIARQVVMALRRSSNA